MMRRLFYIFLGALIGIALTAGGGVFAASTGLLGQKITGQVPIIYNGEQLSASGYVAAGTTLLPLRSIASILGIGAEYKDGKVYLSEAGDVDVPDAPISIPAPTDGTSGQDQSGSQAPQLTAEEIQKQLDDINARIEQANKYLQDAQNLLEGFKADPKAVDMVTLFEKTVQADQQAIDNLNKQKADLEAQLQAMQDNE